MSAVSMNARLFVTVLAVGLGAPAVAWAQSTDAIGSPQHFIFFGLERSRVSDPIFLATPSIAGGAALMPTTHDGPRWRDYS